MQFDLSFNVLKLILSPDVFELIMLYDVLQINVTKSVWKTSNDNDGLQTGVLQLLLSYSVKQTVIAI